MAGTQQEWFCTGRARSEDNGTQAPGRPSPGEILQQLATLPDGPGSGASLRRFWAAFCKIDLYPLKDGSMSSSAAIIDKAFQRCLHATHPFKLVSELLENQWQLRARGGSAKKSGGEAAAAAARTADQWNMILAVQRVLGRPPETESDAKATKEIPQATTWGRWQQAKGSGDTNQAKEPMKKLSLEEARSRALKDVPTVIRDRRELFLEHARAFQFVAATLTETSDRISKKKGKLSAKQVFIDKVTALIVVQRVVPEEWRSGHADPDDLHANGRHSSVRSLAEPGDTSQCCVQ
mmetsp:Transcript_155601/g.274815  ORF Transcript_155601/g.274815 Transcript_155601/m.274815 type:complete len:293 (-) Transcript_155601:39-917(-)